MAIDDNTLYGLTGAQVKELPERIEAVKGLAKVLTTDDYNWPTTGTPTSVALWLLAPGIYEVGSNLEVRDTSATFISTASDSGRGAIAIVGGARTDGNVNTKPIVSFAPNGKNAYYAIVDKNVGGIVGNRGRFLLSSDVKNNLTSTSTDTPLSANEGRFLKSQIGDLTALDTTVKTDLVSAINEVAGQSGGSYTAGDGIDITNSVISATNTGKARELTTDDYNYPTDNPTSVALWLLEPGIYAAIATSSQSVKILRYSTDTAVRDTGVFLVGDYSSGYKSIVNFSEKGSNYCIVTSDAGILFGAIKKLVTSVVDNLTSTYTEAALSANQGRVLKDLIDSIAIRGAGAPTTSTVGTVGQLYEDGTNGALYQLKSIDITVTPNTYNWEQVGGSSVNVVQTTGTSTTDVMSQNAVTSMVFADPSTRNRVCIGLSASASNNGNIAIGTIATARNNNDAIAIGRYADASANFSIALGSYSQANTRGQFDISTGTQTTSGYNNSNYRLLTGLYDPQSDHDAATKVYVDTAVSGISVPDTFTTNEWDALWA